MFTHVKMVLPNKYEHTFDNNNNLTITNPRIPTNDIIIFLLNKFVGQFFISTARNPLTPYNLASVQAYKELPWALDSCQRNSKVGARIHHLKSASLESLLGKVCDEIPVCTTKQCPCSRSPCSCLQTNQAKIICHESLNSIYFDSFKF